MNTERAIMRGQLVELRQKQTRLRYRIKGDADAIKTRLNTNITQPDDLQVPIIDEQWDQLKLAWAELVSVNARISELERELE